MLNEAVSRIVLRIGIKGRTKKRGARHFLQSQKVARVTGLEPATSGVTGRHSNQLSYTRVSRRVVSVAARGVV